MPPPIGCEGSNKEFVEDDCVTPLAGGNVVTCLRLLDVKNPTKSLWKTTVSHHWLEYMLCYAMPPPIPIGCEGSDKEPVEEAAVLPLAGGPVVSCLRLLDATGPTQSLQKAAVPHHWLEDILCHAIAYWTWRIQQRTYGR